MRCQVRMLSTTKTPRPDSVLVKAKRRPQICAGFFAHPTLSNTVQHHHYRSRAIIHITQCSTQHLFLPPFHQLFKAHLLALAPKWRPPWLSSPSAVLLPSVLPPPRLASPARRQRPPLSELSPASSSRALCALLPKASLLRLCQMDLAFRPCRTCR